mmetsp:Transcript_66508/g.185410  ORF Transcript_66508/g.185410 Transcript_66508/m.185410 type:complete len:138 (+) Transcript_66508:167-580(+)
MTRAAEYSPRGREDDQVEIFAWDVFGTEPWTSVTTFLVERQATSPEPCDARREAQPRQEAQPRRKADPTKPGPADAFWESYCRQGTFRPNKVGPMPRRPSSVGVSFQTYVDENAADFDNLLALEPQDGWAFRFTPSA